ncbi:Beta-1,3-galactosyltransferase [Nesidiocoris tenuis]|uniref:Hexosyltransferase n=1 Tax=Nesidiocoris tenuis TaxID=355587 RepID=A0ABN7B5Y3_9HEMI|nr:Beta-1,3-galactosyltransferase [Nesidiocoris tenuis]
MRIRISFISHVLAFVLGISVALLLLGIQLATENGAEVTKNTYGTLYAVLSAPDHSSQRDAIRESWATFLQGDDTYVFSIGALGLTEDMRQQLVLEQQLYGDLLIVPVVEKYRNLTTKQLATLEQLVRNRSFKYLVKADDDTYLNVDGIRRELKDAPEKRFYWGYFHGTAPVFKSGKWKETEWFLSDRYLPYALGGAYVISYDLVLYIVNNAHLLSKYTSEDVSMGTWLGPLNITRRHDTRFDTGWKSRGCANNRLALHRQLPGDMRTFASRLRDGLPLCEKETVLIPAYRYNWNVLPSKCCSELENAP